MVALLDDDRAAAADVNTDAMMAMCGDIAEAATALTAIRRLAPGIERWVEESETTWIRKDDYRKYVEAFRMAGL